jgi:two-component system phosphate regulon sensor histidine kinase PhoR
MINRWIIFAACMIVGGGLGFWARTVNGLSFGLGIGLAVGPWSGW